MPSRRFFHSAARRQTRAQVWTFFAQVKTQQGFRRFAGTLHQANDELYRYTSGRWLYNEKKRLEERYLPFDIAALRAAAASSLNCREEEISSITKLAEGGFNRVLEVAMQDDLKIIARLPYPSTQPKCLATASEVATMDLARSHGIPTPIVYGYSTDSSNAVGSEYIFMEKVSGRCLADCWFNLDDKQRVKVLSAIVDQEAKLFKIPLPAYGSVFLTSDLPAHHHRIRTGEQDNRFCVGPDVSLKHWFGTRSELDIQRGPALRSLDVLHAAAKKESAWLRRYGKPRLPFDREYREILGYKKMDPEDHIRALDDYLSVMSYLVPREDWLHKPVLRHPDLTPNNIFVDEDCNITSIIDWQHSSVLPLFLQTGIPKFFQNYGDPDLEALRKPAMPNRDDLDEEDYQNDVELYRRRHAHFYYIVATAAKCKLHYKALEQDGGLFRKKIHSHAAEPWEGNSIPLKADLVQLITEWSTFAGSGVACPIECSARAAHDIMEKASRQEDVDAKMEIFRDVVGINTDGWVPCERYHDSVAEGAAMKAMALSVADDELERDAILKHWLLDDFDEDE